MTRATGLSDGVGLQRLNGNDYVFYREDADSIRIDLSAMQSPQPVVAVDCLEPYVEISLGTLPPGDQRIRLAKRSDWAVAIGTFARADAR
jgi:hypothetical protein